MRTKIQKKDYWTVLGTMGDYSAGIGGTLISFLAFIFIYLSFREQAQANRMQTKANEQDRIESRFFQLLNLHKSNVKELKFSHFYNKIILNDEGKYERKALPGVAEKRKFFVIIYDQFHTLQQELKIVYDKYDAPFIYESAYTSKFQYNQTYRLREIDAKHIAVVDMLYLIVFFGVGRTGRQAIEEHTNGRYNKAFVSEMIEMAALKPKLESDIYDRWQEVYESSDREEKAKRQIMANQAAQKIKKIREAEPHLQPAISYLEADGVYSSEYSKFYGGHQFRLAHYFRHLYQTVSYIHHSEIDKQQKEEYIRHLRGQLSNNEQITIFLNSLSQMGRSWELETKKDGKMIQPAHQFISKYHLIKNISVNEVMPGIKLSDYYPEINYDAFEKEP